MNTTQKIIIVVVFLAVIVGGALYLDKNKKEETVNPYADSVVTTTILTNSDGTFGYDILIDGNIYVHQPTKPAVGGNTGFATEAEAQYVAELVISKIKNNMLPPSVTPEEIKSMSN